MTMASSTRDRRREAALILLKRRRARVNYVNFCEYLFPDEPPALHHKVLCNALDEIVAGTLRRLMVFMPPGSAKSSYSSVRFPPYFLGRFPNKSIICLSSDEALATSFGRRVRNIVDSADYGYLFETRLSEDARAKGEWETKEGGAYFAAGMTSNIIGRRADLGIIDDPIKGRKEADSITVRNDTWDRYKVDFLSRLKPGAAQVMISTRWVEDDPAGRILPPSWCGESGDFIGFDGQSWRVICIPAEARENDILGRKVGEYLWLDWFTAEYWKETKAAQTGKDIRNWSSLWQQIPQPESGDFFKREWFKRFELGTEPAITKYGASDYGTTNDGDPTEHGIGGFDATDNLYFVDWWSGQVTTDIGIDKQLDLAKKHSIYLWLGEVGQIRRSVEPFLINRKNERKIYFTGKWLPHIGDKGQNARGFQAWASMGKVYIPYGEWGEALLDQLIRFIPNTNYRDDKVDVCGLFGRMLDNAFGPRPSIIHEQPQRDSYGLDDSLAQHWKLN